MDGCMYNDRIKNNRTHIFGKNGMDVDVIVMEWWESKGANGQHLQSSFTLPRYEDGS